MARYRLYLSDADDFVQETLFVDCSSDDVALDFARKLIKDNGQVKLWDDSQTSTGPWVGCLRLHPGPLSSAWVRRIHPMPAFSA